MNRKAARHQLARLVGSYPYARRLVHHSSNQPIGSAASCANCAEISSCAIANSTLSFEEGKNCVAILEMVNIVLPEDQESME